MDGVSYYTDPLVTLLHGDCLEVLPALEADSVDAVVTDPPYGLEFMGKGWDKFVPSAKFAIKTYKDGSTAPLPNYHGADNPTCRNCGGLQSGKSGKKGQAPCRCDAPRFDNANGLRRMIAFQAWCEQWGREALRVTKPGGYLLAFGGTRTHHRLVCALEDAGWIIRDELTWIYASGFPKGKANLKPAHEPIVLARKPGPLRPLGIDATRITTSEELRREVGGWQSEYVGGESRPINTFDLHPEGIPGRWPSNVLLSDPELFDQPNPYVVGSGATSVVGWDKTRPPRQTGTVYGEHQASSFDSHGDSGGYSRFFIVPKSDRAERERGLESLALRLHRERGECDKLPAWESGDRSPSDQTASTSPVRAISEDTTEADDSSSDTSAPGKPPTGRSPRATRSTTSTGIRRTTPSTTSSSLTPSATSESTPGASLSMGFGGSPAESADSSDPSPRSGGTSLEKDGPSTDGAGPATSARWSKRNACADCGKPLPRGSSHPTVKPIDLMRHLVRLVCPPGGTILDPFLGSGTTCLAASEEGFRSIGIERELEYLEIAKGRLMATPMGLGLDHGLAGKASPKTHPDLSKHQPKRRAPGENYSGGWAGTDEEPAA
jgi:DNA modification methylase